MATTRGAIMTTQLVIIEKGNELEALSTEKGIQSLIARATQALIDNKVSHTAIKY